MGKKTDDYVAGRVNSVIGYGTEFEGTIRTCETVRIEGTFKGTIESEGTVIVGNGGVANGTINAVNILIGGEAYGDLFASNKVEANASGRIYGNIHTKSLIVDENAIFQGTCEMTGRDDNSGKEDAEEESTEKPEE